MNNVIDKRAYYEVYVILKSLDLLTELPEDVRILIAENGDCEEKFVFDKDIPLFEQIHNEKTKILLSYLYLKYINKNEREKKILLEKYKKNEIRFQKEINEKYSINNLFNKDVAVSNQEKKAEDMNLIEYKKENVFKRMFDKIKAFIMHRNERY